jgi:hypothetical protein
MRVLIFLLATIFATQAMACDLPIKQPLQVVSLWHDKKLSSMENINRIKELCQSSHYSADCVEKILQPSLQVLPIFLAPDAQIPFGAITVKYSPSDQSVETYYVSFGPLEAPIRFDVDIYTGWDYTPYLHQTVIDRLNDWYLVPLPSVSGHKTGWLKIVGVSDAIVDFKKDDIVYFKGKNYVILKVGDKSVSMREEQPSDMWCESVSPPPLKAYDAIEIQISDLYDKDCHILLLPAHTKGC